MSKVASSCAPMLSSSVCTTSGVIELPSACPAYACCACLSVAGAKLSHHATPAKHGADLRADHGHTFVPPSLWAVASWEKICSHLQSLHSTFGWPACDWQMVQGLDVHGSRGMQPDLKLNGGPLYQVCINASLRPAMPFPGRKGSFSFQADYKSASVPCAVWWRTMQLMSAP